MKKVVVIGSGGSGKSTFSRQLGEVTGLPVVHLDKLYWHAGWVKTPAPVWQSIVQRELAKTKWIMDGNFGGTRAMRLAEATTENRSSRAAAAWRCPLSSRRAR